ncbi:MAG TPA: SurA N-terminal domain-containing protein [Devosia sp.]|jgi:peptidyl-prolyl cis-trans isomerase SurA|nr:SurA N-terminal domain-containing protein [Devosia sp.]
MAAVLVLAAALPAAALGVRVTVNQTQITDAQIAQRAKLLKLQSQKGNLEKTAEEQLIDEALEMQDAKNYNISVTDAQVDAQVTSMAQGLRMSEDKLQQILSANGVGMQTLRDQIKASLALNQLTQNVISARVTFSEADLAKQAATKITPAQSYDYILKQVLFLTPNGKGSRVADANRYRARFKGCDSAVELSQSFTDAAVTDIGRRHATQLPATLAAELAKLPVGGISQPHQEAAGTTMYAICSKEEAKDLTFITNQLRQSEGTTALKDQTDKYIADLKSKAKIIYSK